MEWIKMLQYDMGCDRMFLQQNRTEQFKNKMEKMETMGYYGKQLKNIGEVPLKHKK